MASLTTILISDNNARMACMDWISYHGRCYATVAVLKWLRAELTKWRSFSPVIDLNNECGCSWKSHVYITLVRLTENFSGEKMVQHRPIQSFLSTRSGKVTGKGGEKKRNGVKEGEWRKEKENVPWLLGNGAMVVVDRRPWVSWVKVEHSHISVRYRFIIILRYIAAVNRVHFPLMQHCIVDSAPSLSAVQL